MAYISCITTENSALVKVYKQDDHNEEWLRIRIPMYILAKAYVL